MLKILRMTMYVKDQFSKTVGYGDQTRSHIPRKEKNELQSKKSSLPASHEPNISRRSFLEAKLKRREEIQNQEWEEYEHLQRKLLDLRLRSERAHKEKYFQMYEQLELEYLDLLMEDWSNESNYLEMEESNFDQCEDTWKVPTPMVDVTFRLENDGRHWNDVKELKSFQTITTVLQKFFNINLKHDLSGDVKIWYAIDTGNRNYVNNKDQVISIVSVESAFDQTLEQGPNQFKFLNNAGTIFGTEGYEYLKMKASSSWNTFLRLNDELRKFGTVNESQKELQHDHNSRMEPDHNNKHGRTNKQMKNSCKAKNNFKA